jgi:hypothetical protein
LKIILLFKFHDCSYKTSQRYLMQERLTADLWNIN